LNPVAGELRVVDGNVYGVMPKIIQADIVADNAIIHVVDRVLSLPKPIRQALPRIPSLSVFSSITEKVNFLPYLESLRRFTLFAPADVAFERVNPKAAGVAVLSATMKQRWYDIFQSYIIPNQLVVSPRIPLGVTAVPSASEVGIRRSLSITKRANRIQVNNANVIRSDLLVENGVIHIIDQLMARAPRATRPSRGSRVPIEYPSGARRQQMRESVEETEAPGFPEEQQEEEVGAEAPESEQATMSKLRM